MAPLAIVCLQRAIAGVEAAHEADLHEAAAERGLGVEDRRAVALRRRQRLLAEHGLARGDRGEHISRVRRSPGGHDHGVHVLGGDQLLAGRIGLGAGQARSDLLGLRCVDVADRDDARAREDARQPPNVILADHPNADHADIDSHLVPPGNELAKRKAAQGFALPSPFGLPQYLST